MRPARRQMVEIEATRGTIMANEKKSSFEKVAAKNKGIVGEFLDYLKTNKKWWLLPILGMFLIIGVLLLLSTTAAAPFIYTLF